MEFPPDTYFIFPAEHFETAGPRIIGDYTAEILAQARPNGRVMDHWRVILGGNKALEAEVDLAKLVPAAATLPKVVVEALSGLQDKSSNSASCRWAVCVGEAGKLELQLQFLPCPVNLLTGKPIFRR